MVVVDVRQSAEFISKHAEHVRVNQDGIDGIAHMVLNALRNGSYSVKTWKQHHLHPKSMNEATINWILVLDTLNFSFWPDGAEKFVVQYNKQTYTGYWSLCAVINRALDEGIPITTPEFFANVTLEEMEYIFRSETCTQIPLLASRTENLHEVGKELVKNYHGSFVNFIRLCNHSAKKLLDCIARSFNCFNDVSVFHGTEVGFYKRAQILIADIWACFEGKGFGFFHDIDYITMFADYRIPQVSLTEASFRIVTEVLVYMNALTYSKSLMAHLKEGTEIQSGDLLELEIRGCCVWAVEKDKIIDANECRTLTA